MLARLSLRRRSVMSAWARLVLTIRVLAGASAVVLLLAHRVTDFDSALIVAVCAYVLVSSGVVFALPEVTSRPAAWALDTGAALTLVVLSGDWRSPFFLLAVSTLVTPAVTLGPRQALTVGLAFSGAYLVIGQLIGPPVLEIGSQTTLETLGTHLVLPVLVCLGAAWVAGALRQLREERSRTERLAIEAERRRIAWELHDSAKARVHAAHLVLSALRDGPTEQLRGAVDQAMGELVAAAADMDTSLAELISPLEGRPIDVALRDRAREFSSAPDAPRFTVRGSAGDLDPLQAAHAYRIAAEALLNAARHAGADHVDVTLERDERGVRIVVADDGRGLPDNGRPAANGLRVMRSRARTIGASLDFSAGRDGRGTVVSLQIPAQQNEGAPA